MEYLIPTTTITKLWLEKGIQIGEEKAKVDIICAAFKKLANIELVAEITKSSAEDVKRILIANGLM